MVMTSRVEQVSAPPQVEPSPLIPTEVPLRRLTVDEYHRMINAGIFDEDERVELIDGLLIQMTPQRRPHARVIQRLNRALVRQLGDDYAVLPQLPLTLADDAEPEPDLAVVSAAEAASHEHHPRTASLVIEVAHGLLGFDRASKATLYARSGIPEYWIVNVKDECVEVYRDPDVNGARYRTTATFASGQVLSPSTLPGLSIPVADLFA